MKNKDATFEIITTDDGSESFNSKLYNENGHSTSGGKLETITHYVNGCELQQKIIDQDEITIFETGFGIGIGFLTTLEVLGTNKKINFISVEIDENLLIYVQAKKEFSGLSKTNINGIDVFTMNKDNITLTVFMGDARKNIKYIKDNYKVDAIYQDAFSPKRNPMLWTTEWFKDLKDLSNEECILSTYSSSSSIRKALISAGWNVYHGEKFGPKRSSTRAKLTGSTDPAILERLERSPAITLTDELAPTYKIKST